MKRRTPIGSPRGPRIRPAPSIEGSDHPVTTRRSNKREPSDRDASAFAGAIKAALGETDGNATKLHRVAQTLVTLAIDGNMAAIKEISERLDGKAGAQRERTAKPAADPIEVRVKWLKD